MCSQTSWECKPSRPLTWSSISGSSCSRDHTTSCFSETDFFCKLPISSYGFCVLVCTPGLWLACDVIPVNASTHLWSQPHLHFRVKYNAESKKERFLLGWPKSHLLWTGIRSTSGYGHIFHARLEPERTWFAFLVKEVKTCGPNFLKRKIRNFRTEFKICSEFLIHIFSWWDCWVRTLYQVWKQIAKKLFNEALMKV